MQNDPHRFKIKLEKFHCDILCCYGVIKESLPGGRNPPPGEIGLNNVIGCLETKLLTNVMSTKNLGVVKNYVGSFSSNVEDNTDKTRKRQV